MNSNSPSNTRALIIGLTFLVIIISAAGLLYLTYNPNSAPQAFFARDINDATYNCEDKIVAYYQTNLINKRFDNLSSRYDANKRQYAIFYRVTVKEQKQQYTQVMDYMVKCTVWETLGYVSEFTIFDV